MSPYEEALRKQIALCIEVIGSKSHHKTRKRVSHYVRRLVHGTNVPRDLHVLRTRQDKFSDLPLFESLDDV